MWSGDLSVASLLRDDIDELDRASLHQACVLQGPALVIEGRRPGNRWKYDRTDVEEAHQDPDAAIVAG